MKNHTVTKPSPNKNIFAPLLIAICLFLFTLPLSAQEQTTQTEDFWISPGAELALYSPVNMAYGGGITLAYGNGTSIGIKASWLFDHEGHLSVLVFNVLFRLYFYGSSANSGPFAQLAGGPAIFFDSEERISFPARIGAISTGLTFGWRFLLGKYFFLEPSLSIGYPYIAGGSLSAGVRF